jgi:hypothetical protein
VSLGGMVPPRLEKVHMIFDFIMYLKKAQPQGRHLDHASQTFHDLPSPSSLFRDAKRCAIMGETIRSFS